MNLKGMIAMSREYWNDIELEKTKAYWVEDVSDLKLLHFLQNETNLQKCFQDAVGFANQFNGGVCGHVLDIGAGVAWTSALLSRIDKVESITATDYSEHRLNKIAPIVFKQLGGNERKFIPVVGDFLDLDFPINHYRTILFCQCLYMFPDLDKVLDKVSGLLAPDGILMVVCERITLEYSIYSINGFKKKLRQLLKGRADSSGNHNYEDRDYRCAIEKAGLNYRFQLLKYPVYPKNNTWKAGNHFGIKAKG